MSEPSGYSLKAHCSHCGACGTVDDGSLICGRCHQAHEISPAELSRRNADIMLQQQAALLYRSAS